MNISRKILEIGNCIRHNWNLSPYNEDLSLMTGIGGVPVFFYQLYKYTGDKSYIKEIENVIYFIFDKINNQEIEINPTYCSGLAGIGFMIHLLDQTEELKHLELHEELDTIDDVLLEVVSIFLQNIDEIDASNKAEHIDFLHGIFGIAYYLLERSQYKDYSNILILLFEKLAEIVITESNYSYLMSTKSFDDEDLYKTNLGLAHGHISYILIFCRFIEIFPNNKNVINAIKKSTETIFLFKNNSGLKNESIFPSIAVNKQTANYNIHLGWCYGDQTISYGLAKASKILKDVCLMNSAIEIAQTTLSRSDCKSALLSDKNYEPGFCHGTISVAYYHKIWFKLSNDKRFKYLYEIFKQETLLLGSSKKGLAGYTKKNIYGNDISSIGILDGISGIGIFLIDAEIKNNKSLNWQSIFLLE